MVSSMEQLITTPSQVGEIVRRRRKSRRLPQREVAAKLGVSQGRLSALEADPAKLTLERLLVLANLLGLDLVLKDKQKTTASASEW
jgi:HTH-type transcriptional regulator / antitoxin HipB